MPSSTSPILVIDSGLGGLTVVRALRLNLPDEDILYFGDTARLPYGSKSQATVTGFVREILQYLLPRDPKHVILACNTATALALRTIRQEFPELSISGVIEPGARAAVDAVATTSPLIGIIGTEATVRSRAYEQAILRHRPEARVLAQATPLLAPIVEEGRPATDPLVHLALRQYLGPLLEAHIHVLVLGCTHYPVYTDLISDIVGPAVAVIDSANQCAEDVGRRLSAAGLTRVDRRGEATLRCFVTDNSPRFASLAQRFLGMTLEPPVWVAPEDLHGAADAPVLRSAI
jgi:glutamate racemase